MENEKASVKLSTKSWHYKLIKWTLGSNAPTPYNMHNLCPYFWLLVFSIIVQPVFAPCKVVIKALDWLGEKMYNGLDNLSKPAAEEWLNNLTDMQAYMLYEKYYWEDCKYTSLVDEKLEIPYNFKRIQKLSPSTILRMWLKEKKGIEMYSGDEKYAEWKRSVEEKLYANKANIRKTQSPKPEPKIKIVLESLASAVTDVLNKIAAAFDGWKNIIKWTKRFVGAMITAAGLTLTFFIIQYLGRGIIYVVQHWDWSTFWFLVIFASSIALVALLIWLLGMFAEYLRAKDYNTWYAKLFYYVIVLPLKWIFIDFVWHILILKVLIEFLCINIIFEGAILLWKGIKGFLGIFGEYFGASYGDYCPGIDWEENNSNDRSSNIYKPIDPSTNL